MIAQPKDTRPSPLSVLSAGLPPELAGITGYVVWRYQYRNGRWTKPAMDAAGRLIDVTDPSTWRPLPAVLAQLAAGGCDGIGIATGALRAAGMAAGDLDHCMGDDGEPLPWAEEIVETFPTYWERSPSDQGLRGFFYADLPDLPTNVKKNGIELHAGRGYVTLTGHRLAGTPATVEPCQEAANALLRRLRPAEGSAPPPPPADGPTALLSDDDVIEKAMRARNGATIRALWEGDDLDHASASEADAALAAALAFYVRGDVDQLVRAMGRSKRAQRDKVRDRPAYLRGTCERAIRTCTRHYEPPPPRPRLLIGGKAADGQSQGGGAGQAEEPARTAGGTEDPGDGMPQTLSAAHALVRQLTAERDAERAARIVAEQRAEEAERTAARAYELQSRTVSMIGNKALGQKRMAGPLLLHAMEISEKKGEEWTRLPLKAIAQAAGASEKTAGRYLQQYEAAGLIERDVRDVPEQVNSETGEIIPYHSEIWVKPVENVRLLARKLTTPPAGQDDPPERTWGGKRIACPDHPAAAVIKRTVWSCGECGDVLAEREVSIAADATVHADQPPATEVGGQVVHQKAEPYPPVTVTNTKADKLSVIPSTVPGGSLDSSAGQDDPPRYSPEFWEARSRELGRIDAEARARYGPPQASA